MPYTLKTSQISVKDPETGEYSGVDILAEQTEQGLIAELQAEGTTQVNRINQAAVAVQAAVDQAESDAATIISDTQTSINTLEAQKNTIAQTVASMAELGTDTTLSTPGMAADAGAVGDLSRQISDLESALEVETTLPGWEKGSFDTTNGTNYADNSRIRNQTKVGVSTGVQGFTLADGYSTLMYAWDLSGTYVGAYKTDGTWTKTVSGWKSVTEFNLSTVPNYVIKFAMARVPSSADITPNEGSNAILYSYTDDTLTKGGKAADAEKVGDELKNLNRHFNDLVLDNYVWTNPENWLNPNGFKAGEINAYNGREEEYAGICHTDYFIPVEPGKTIYFNRMDNGAGLYMRGFVAYNSNQEFMSGGTGASAMTYTVPANCYYVKINVDGTPPIATTLKLMIYIGDSAPTVYSEYFAPHYVIETNFVNPETEESLEKLVSGQFSTLDIQHKYHCSFPRNRLRMTVGIPETFYYFSAITPYKTTYGQLSAGVQFSTFGNDCTIFENASVYHGNNGYMWYMYDATLTLIDSFVGAGVGAPRTWLTENLQSCSLLAIGDSTVDQDYMTQGLLDHFTAQGATITLLGTLGSGLNRNEGRAGWKATDYLTDRQYGGVTNPFYNPTTKTFDFSYYMTNQGYTAPDFVVLQLGLNDLGTKTNAEIWAAIKTMVDSIIAYNAAIKIILNLPNTPNQDQEKISDWLPLSTSRECSYNEYAQAHALSEYGDTKVRCSYCHLILNPATDIRDNVHPTEAGYNKMALEIANQINHWQNGN